MTHSTRFVGIFSAHPLPMSVFTPTMLFRRRTPSKRFAALPYGAGEAIIIDIHAQEFTCLFS